MDLMPCRSRAVLVLAAVVAAVSKKIHMANKSTAKGPALNSRSSSSRSKAPAPRKVASMPTPNAKRVRAKAGAPKPAPVPVLAPTGGKQAVLITMLRSAAGATIAQMTEATGWLPHTVRGTISGVLRKKKGLNVIAEKRAGGAVYRISEGPVA
jgi:hypothetical protein